MRARNGGISRLIPLRRKNRSWRNPPRRTSASRYRVVAATNGRRSTGVSPLPPGGPRGSRWSAAAWCSVCRHLADLVQEHGAAVGGFEQAHLGARAPLNEPFSCPNSSLSISDADRPAQLSATKSPDAPKLVNRSCQDILADAVSPRISTLMLADAARLASSRMCPFLPRWPILIRGRAARNAFGLPPPTGCLTSAFGPRQKRVGGSPSRGYQPRHGARRISARRSSAARSPPVASRRRRALDNRILVVARPVRREEVGVTGWSSPAPARPWSRALGRRTRARAKVADVAAARAHSSSRRPSKYPCDHSRRSPRQGVLLHHQDGARPMVIRLTREEGGPLSPR